jgi:hypothetical protein
LQGFVYSYSLVNEDLLGGSGPEMIGLQPGSDGGYEDHPQVVAEKICAAYLKEVMSSGSDGLSLDPRYVVFVKNEAGALNLCNATGDAMVWAFEPIGDPLKLDCTPAQS